MTRIVAGAAKGRALAVPARGTRPTSDRAREALFNTLAGLLDLDGARVLDLYAGTGAVGLEALSRGAAHVTFVESDRTAAATVQRNVDAVGLPGAVVVRTTVEAYLGRGPEAPADFVYADPPYALDEYALAGVLTALAEPGWLTPAGIVVVERSARGPEPRWPNVIQSVKQKRYGEGLLWYGQRR
ncbi:MAG TPA: 16S rRNA (guanine(966)-N(2))-methyltransferase RsmD [Jatrophihabitantaceae bacterium]